MTAPHNPHALRRLFDVLTDAEIAHQLTGVGHHAYLSRRRRELRGLAGRELDRILALGPERVPAWMDVFIHEFDDFPT